MLQYRHTVDRYLSDDARLVKVVCRLEPTVPTTVMIAIEMPAAIRPYSMAVAPVSFVRKSLSVFMTHPFFLNSPNGLTPNPWVR